MTNLVVVGGGTAGWLTALYAKKNFPQHNVTLIESQEIGILGAGEGTLTNFVDFARYLDIDFKDLVKETKATLKSGIKFTNWSEDKDFYYHGFGSNPQDLGNFKQLDLNNNFFSSEYLYPNIQNKYNEMFIDASEQNKVMFVFNGMHGDSLRSFDQYCRYGFHFDAREMARFLSNLGQSRGINIVEGKVSSFQSLDNGDISAINLENGNVVQSDFIFDCTGFARLIIGKHYGSKWISFKDKLPMKKAIPFFLEMDKDIPPYTEAIAMDYGWMWKIPLQHRYGCGYVFDSDYITEDQAIKEIENYLGYSPQYPRLDKGAFNFNPGCFDKILINNVLAAGLSSGFVEPLEATSLAQLIVLLRRFFTNPKLIVNRNPKYVNYFNQKYVEDSDFIADFIQMHYLTNKTNTPFWEHFKNNNAISDSLIERISVMNESMTLDDEFFSMHSFYSYYSVANGLGLIDKDHIIQTYNRLGFNSFENKINNEAKKQETIIKSLLLHKDFLKKLGAFDGQ